MWIRSCDLAYPWQAMLLSLVPPTSPVLHQVAEPVTVFDASLRQLTEDMAETLYTERGVGLAAPQVGISRRLFLVDVEDGRALRVFINPKILCRSKHSPSAPEGCLTFPGRSKRVARAAHITVEALNERGEVFTRQAEGLEARAILHELDHLLGVTLF